MKSSKLFLIGFDIECMRLVGGVFQQVIDVGDLGVELWGVFSFIIDLFIQEVVMFVLIIDGGIYIYVWDVCCENFFEENFNLWFYLLFLYVFFVNVIFLGVNIIVIYVNKIDLKLF